MESWLDVIQDDDETGITSALDGQTPTALWTASAYIKRYATNPTEPTDGLMPEHGRWIRACRRLWDKLDEIDRAVWMREDADISRSERNRRRWRLYYQLVAETGLESKFTMIIPPAVELKGENEKNEKEPCNSGDLRRTESSDTDA